MDYEKRCERFDQLNLNLKKGLRAEWARLAAARGMNVSEYVRACVAADAARLARGEPLE